MAAQQLHLFTPDKPLLRHFGVEFFHGVPSKPGVYIMGGDTDRVLYIGQSGNLRKRLAAYKNARLGCAPRKVIRLVHSVRTIVWELCESAEAARLRENQLLRIHRPRFNVQNTYPRAYRFISLRMDDGGLALSLGNELKSKAKSYGAFKNGCSAAFGAILRLLWAAIHQPTSPHDFPASFFGARPPRQFRFARFPGQATKGLELWMALLETFLAGDSDALIHALAESLPQGKAISCFQQGLQLNDVEVLSAFFEDGPKRNCSMCEEYGIPSRSIPQQELDDLLVMASKPDGFPS